MINIGRRLRRGTQALALAAALAGGMVALTSAQPAFAAAGGQLAPASCGHFVQEAAGDPVKVTYVWLPAVTGIYSTAQPVWLHVEFIRASAGDGSGQVYRNYWFETYARSGAWSTAWIWKDLQHYSYAEDQPGDTGYTAASQNSFVRVTATWYWGNTPEVSSVPEWASTGQGPYPTTCNY